MSEPRGYVNKDVLTGKVVEFQELPAELKQQVLVASLHESIRQQMKALGVPLPDEIAEYRDHQGRTVRTDGSLSPALEEHFTDYPVRLMYGIEDFGKPSLSNTAVFTITEL